LKSDKETAYFKKGIPFLEEGIALESLGGEKRLPARRPKEKKGLLRRAPETRTKGKPLILRTEEGFHHEGELRKKKLRPISGQTTETPRTGKGRLRPAYKKKPTKMRETHLTQTKLLTTPLGSSFVGGGGDPLRGLSSFVKITSHKREEEIFKGEHSQQPHKG